MAMTRFTEAVFNGKIHIKDVLLLNKNSNFESIQKTAEGEVLLENLRIISSDEILDFNYSK